ncbi:MAG: glycosyltransferase [Bryobacteraceae bacterium]
MATHIFTSAAANYLPKARVLARSVRQIHPDWKIHLVLCDEPTPRLSDLSHFDSIWNLQDLDIPNLKSWLFQHTLVEASTAVKGFALRKLLGLPDCDHVLYFDPDIVVLSALDGLILEFDRSSILLTPHISEPETTEQAIVDNELSVLRHGIYNLGFLGVKNSAEGHRFADWWSDRLESFCFDDIPRGLFTDQRWADLVPAYFSEYQVLRDPVYNVCTWNLTHRAVTGSLAEGLLVNGRPVAFYHFSGFDSGAQQRMLDRYGSNMPSLYELREWYLESCAQMDKEELSSLPWAYDFFENRERILQTHRKRYRESPALQSLFPDPFLAAPESQSYLTWFNRHDERRFQLGPSKGPVQADENRVPAYRIVVIAQPSDALHLSDTCNRILENSFNQSDLVLVISPSAAPARSLPTAFRVLTVEGPRYSNLFLRALDTFADKDLLLIRAGAAPPAFWDLRLAWSAARQPGAFSIAPLDRRVLDASGVFGDLDDETLDCYCYWYRRSTDEEVGTLETDCVYIKSSALADIAGGRKPGSVSDLMNQAARLRYTNLLASHVCLGWKVPRQTSEVLEIARSDRFGNAGSTRWSMNQIRDTLRTYTVDRRSCPIPAVTPGTAPTLHISHSWGGGVERWLSDFIDADKLNDNFVLKSQGPQGAYGTELGLYRYRFDQAPELLETWEVKPRIKATDVANESYRAVLQDLFRQYRFGKVLVSSLIGHSLDCLQTALPTAVVCHDYYPFCSAINLTFGEVCPSCEPPRLRACLEENPFNHSFPNVPVPEWLAIRSEFVRLVRERAIPLVAPSPSVAENYLRALPAVADRFQVIPHGTRRPPCKAIDVSVESESPLRILILGSMAIHKGRLLLEAMVPELLKFADLTIAGCRDFPDQFLSNPRIRVIPSYDRESLCQLVADVRPDIGLLLSVVPEAFSYTLHELQSMGVPPLATRLGSFVDWIKHGENGFLSDPQPGALLDLMRSLHDDKRQLVKVRDRLKDFVLRSSEEMVRDYRALSDTEYSAERYFNGPTAPPPLTGRGLQLYWRTEETGFSERNSVTMLPLGAGRQTVRLGYVTPGSFPTQLRLDFSNEPGFLVLHDLSLKGRKDEVLWSLSGNPEAIRDELLVQSSVVNKNVPGGGMLLCLSGTDPYVLLPIPTSILAQSEGAGSLAVEFTPTPEAEISSDAESGRKDDTVLALQFRIHESLQGLEHVRGELARVNDEHARELHDKEQRLQQANAELAQKERLIEALQDSVSWKITRPLRIVARAGREARDKEDVRE